jgi:hypothetical protein
MGVSEVTNSVGSIGVSEMPAAVLRSDRPTELRLTPIGHTTPTLQMARRQYGIFVEASTHLTLYTERVTLIG